MRWIATSNGLAFGSDDLHAVDIIPMPGMALPTWDYLWMDLKRALMWKEMPGQELRVLKRLYPRRQFKGWMAAGARVIYRVVLPADESMMEAFYTIESAEGEAPREAQHLLAGIVGSFWVSRLATKNRRDPESRLAAAMHMASLMEMDGPVELSERMNRKTLEATAQDFLADLRRGANIVVSPLGGVDKVRYWLIVGRYMWTPEVLRDLSSRYGNMEGHIQLMLWNAGRVYAYIASHLEYASVPLPRRVDLVYDLLVQAHLWAVGGADGQVVGWTLQRPPEFWPVPEGLLWSMGDRARAVAKVLLEDARRHRVYSPRGVFVLRIPEGTPLYAWGVRKLRIRVDERGVWAQVVDDKDKGGVVVRWEPEVGILGRSLIEGADALHVTLAALWRDMVTEGEAALPRADKRSTDRREEMVCPVKRREDRPQRLPRRRLRAFVLSGTRTWGGEAEQKRIYRRAHMVAGHVRRLPEGYEASEEARQAAREAGILLPPGTTWVRPHVRGGRGEEKGTVDERPIVCVGLMQLVGHFRDRE